MTSPSWNLLEAAFVGGMRALLPPPPKKRIRQLGLGLWLVVEAACHPLVSPMRCISYVLKADSGR